MFEATLINEVRGSVSLQLGEMNNRVNMSQYDLIFGQLHVQRDLGIRLQPQNQLILPLLTSEIRKKHILDEDQLEELRQ